MKKIEIRFPSGKRFQFESNCKYDIEFRSIEGAKSNEPNLSIIQVDGMAFDFEVHDHGDKISVGREFHIETPQPLLRAMEKATFQYLVSLGVFELIYEDGLPYLCKQWNK